MSWIDWALGLLMTGALWCIVFGFAAHNRRQRRERRELRRSAERVLMGNQSWPERVKSLRRP